MANVETLDIRRVKEVTNTTAANDLLDDGWTLLSVAQMPDGQPVYVLGHDNEEADR